LNPSARGPHSSTPPLLTLFPSPSQLWKGHTGQTEVAIVARAVTNDAFIFSLASAVLTLKSSPATLKTVCAAVGKLMERVIKSEVSMSSKTKLMRKSNADKSDAPYLGYLAPHAFELICNLCVEDAGCRKLLSTYVTGDSGGIAAVLAENWFVDVFGWQDGADNKGERMQIGFYFAGVTALQVLTSSSATPPATVFVETLGRLVRRVREEGLPRRHETVSERAQKNERRRRTNTSSFALASGSVSPTPPPLREPAAASHRHLLLCASQR
jgi:hypothetical protein